MQYIMSKQMLDAIIESGTSYNMELRGDVWYIDGVPVYILDDKGFFTDNCPYIIPSKT